MGAFSDCPILVVFISFLVYEASSYGSYGSKTRYGYTFKPSFENIFGNSNTYTYRGQQRHYVTRSYGSGRSYGVNGGSYDSGGSYGISYPKEVLNNYYDQHYANGGEHGGANSKISKYVGGCNGQPPAPLNSGMRCTSLTGCKADCVPDYHFPDGKTQVSIICENGEWKVADANWDVIPSCQPICNPQCENNGICVEPNQCSCPENFSGSLCEYENKPCLVYPVTPKNARRQCRKKMCTISCMFNHEFPDGSSILQYECKNGVWVTMGEKWKSAVPDCQAICNPPCENGGNCLAFNVCQCPTDFRGPSCQYSTSVCNPKKLAFNGGYSCSGDMNAFKCSITCPDGIPFEYPPEPEYICQYSTGQFFPQTMPQCVYSSEVGVTYDGTKDNKIVHEFVPAVSQYYQPKMLTTSSSLIFDSNPDLNRVLNYIQQKEGVDILPKKCDCLAWNSNHYKTFDGKVYSFGSKCPYVLLRDSQDDTFSIVVQNSPTCFNSGTDEQICYKEVKIYLNDNEYELRRSETGAPIFTNGKKTIPVPGQLPGIRISMLPPNLIVVYLDSVGATVKWDGNQLVRVQAKENLWKRTEGLCGIMDGSTKNDIITKDGLLPENIITMAASWGVRELDDECRDPPSEEHACFKPIFGTDSEASLYCKQILTDPRFAACASVIDINVLLDSCKWDYCACKHPDPATCVCPTIEIFVHECKEMGVFNEPWRDESICPMRCTGGKVYMACGPTMGEEMCGSTILFSESGENCIEGCYCPQGTVLHEGKCITKEQCPCTQRGKEFAPGTSIQKDCNTCTCVLGEWTCTKVSCGARCAAVGDPHYVTFDGKRYDFMGQCSYYLVKAETFSIEAENVACAGSISLAMNFPVGVAEGLPSCTRTVTVRYNDQIVKLKQNHNVIINGIDFTKLPYSLSGIDIRMASSIFLKVELDNGVQVWWDGATRVYVDLPGNFREKTKGLCGTFNNNQKDDFLTLEEDVEHSVIPFCNKWKTEELCENVPIPLGTPHPCDLQIYNKAKAENYCAKIKLPIFKDCRWYVDPEPYYQDCLFDMCACRYKVSQCLCPTLSAYATECSRKGVNIEWRNEVRECGVQCSGGQMYQVCGNACTRTCTDIASNTNCKSQCVEGCNCPLGETLDENGECIPIGQCKCEHQGMKYPPGYKQIRSGTRGSELCTCIQAIWQCRPANFKEIPQFPNETLPNTCDTSKNFEFTTCEDVEPVTCKNMHHQDHYSPAICHAGCNCKDGYVLDTTNNICVKPTLCPCHHGGRSYGENASVQNDCNICVCKHGRWKCTDRQCSAECRTWGDSHYKTFDGKYYDYQGQCDYVLAKGSLGSYSFDISMQVVPCGSMGTSCPKSVTLRISVSGDFESITLTHDKPIPLFANKKYMIIRQKALFVILESPDLGLRVHWDKGTRIYIKINPEWKNKLRGLCGNYNDDAQDDFQTPSGGPPEVLPIVFGDSWRLQSYCPDATDLIDTCEDRPDRRVWALKQCGILKTSIFEACHTEVPIEEYFNRCVFDSCGCDQGGDCECLCTALAAYAQECNNRGVPVKWRSQELCPIQCDEEGFQYNPCISTCPYETCDNLLDNSKDKFCEKDSCIEGCSPKSCLLDHIYLNSSYKDCVPRSQCKPVCLEIGGNVFYEGDLIEEDTCHTCYCSQNQKVCIGQPCDSKSTSTPSIPLPNTEFSCQNGFSQWINQDPLKHFQIKLNDIEPIPDSFVLSLLEGAKCDRKYITGIQCRTVDTHIPAKETGYDVECSLERGLICKSNDVKNPCPDFEIKVFCDCASTISCDINRPYYEHPNDCRKYIQCIKTPAGSTQIESICQRGLLYNPLTMACDQAKRVFLNRPECKFPMTTNSTSSIPPPTSTNMCDYGMIFKECAIDCENTCTDYLYTLRESGQCLEGVRCEPGCVPLDRIKCPLGHFYADLNLCVTPQNCMCSNKDILHLKPGQVTIVEGCLHCQCANNFIECIDICTTLDLNSTTENIKTNPGGKTTEPPTTILNIPTCFKNDIISLSGGIFRASSTLNEAFGPENAMFGTTDLNSGGSWVPQLEDKNQFLEIDFGHQEHVYGVIIKGSALYNEYVTSFKVSYSHDNGDNFIYLLDRHNQPEIFRGSYNARDPITQMFSAPFEAQKVRIHPNTWYSKIALRVEVIGCGASIKTTPSPELCDDEMGFANGQIIDSQITVSSEFTHNYGKHNIRLNDPKGWIPLTNSPNEWVTFDLTGPRIITGIVTKGGELGWVTAYKVFYSHDHKEWNPIMEEYNTWHEKIFIGNYDGYSPQVNQFELPLHTRYIKIVPYKWNKMIQLKVELRGCFEPYDSTKLHVEQGYVCSNTCPGAFELEPDSCSCPETGPQSGTWFDGKKCVNRTNCPCITKGISYQPGTVYEGANCDICICKLGGVEQCSPKECPPCKYGERPTVTSTCACACRECPEGQVLCSTSKICIDKNLWCNGLLDCPDDEMDCTASSTTNLGELEEESTTSTSTAGVELPPVCPELSCPPGFQKLRKTPSRSQRYHSYLSPEFSYGGIKPGVQFRKSKTNKGAQKIAYRKSVVPNEGNKTKTVSHRKLNLKNNSDSTGGYTKSGFAKAKHRSLLLDNYPELLGVHLPRPREPVIIEAVECIEWRCVRVLPPHPNDTECPPVECPLDHIPLHDPDQDLRIKECPRYICEPPPNDAKCTITGNTFKTFDNTDFKYDPCYHIIGRDLQNSEWMVALKKNCTQQKCTRAIVIKHDDDEFILYSNNRIDFNGYPYNPENLHEISEEFTINRIGDIVTFNSNKYGFWIVFDIKGNIVFGVVSELKGKVDGLCGFFDHNPSNDKRNPEGKISRTTQEFGDSWTLVNDRPDFCTSPQCPANNYQEALHICNKVKEAPLAACDAYVDANLFVPKCVDTICKELFAVDSNKNLVGPEATQRAKDLIKCNALQMFAVECLTLTSNVDIAEWRMYHNCPALCPAPLVYHDCYQRRCEPNCESVADPYACPKVKNMCFPGCYCPPGFVRNGDTCIEASSCRDYECRLMPNNKLNSFDDHTFSINGKCVYVLSRDVPDMFGKHVWQVLVTQDACDYNPGQICAKKITILYQNHKIHIYSDRRRRGLKFSIDKEAMHVFDKLPAWIRVTESPVKHLTFVFPEVQLEVTVQYPTLATSIKVPSYKYGDRLEGLCGDSNGDKSNDMQTPEGTPVYDNNEFVLSWLFELPGQTRETCEISKQSNLDLTACPENESEICNILLDVNTFGQCLNVIDPGSAFDMCRNITCTARNSPDSAYAATCLIIQYYAQECASKGFCIEWRHISSSCPPEKCPSGQDYLPCSPHQQATCEDIIDKRLITSTGIPSEGCFCPPGLVLLDQTTCVPPEHCGVCDAEGHRPGDVWKKDRCTTCQCDHMTVACNTEVCPNIDTVCDKKQIAVTVDIPGDDQCCPKYYCKPPQDVNVSHCSPPRPMPCGTDQLSKVKVGHDGCAYFSCECIPRIECKPIDDTQVPTDPNDPGYVNVMDNSGCCSRYKLTCVEEKCPMPKRCSLTHNQKTRKEVGRCCPITYCEPRTDICIYETSYTASETGGERRLTKYEKETLTKSPGDHWTDGPCRLCQCEPHSIEGYESVCSLMACPSPENHLDFDDYELTAVPVHEECCPKIKRVACRYMDHVYHVGESWQESKNLCMMVHCVQGELGVQKEITMQACDKKCAPGYVYQEPHPGSGDCCGYCEQIGCVVDGVVHQVGDQWTFDYCTHYSCVGTNGSVQVETTREICDPEPQDMQDYVYDVTDGKCCKFFEISACREGQHIYQVGESWQAFDDLCKTYTCAKKGSNKLVKQTSIEKCHRDCPLGWEYRESPHKCCGTCVQMSCIVGGMLKRAGDIWKSPDGCTAYSCQNYDGELLVSAAEEKCPLIDCDISDQYHEGCCTLCHQNTSQLIIPCTAVTKPIADTIGLIQVNRFPEGKCVNIAPIQDFKECRGSCQSSTVYDQRVGSHETQCTCCQAAGYRSLDVVLMCENGRRWTKSVAVPSRCECLSCGLTDVYDGGNIGILTGVPIEFRKQKMTQSPMKEHQLETSQVPMQRSITAGVKNIEYRKQQQNEKEIQTSLVFPEHRSMTKQGLENKETMLPPFPEHRKAPTTLNPPPDSKKVAETKKLIAKSRKLMMQRQNLFSTEPSPVSERKFQQLLETFGNEDQDTYKNRRKERKQNMNFKRSSGEIDQLINLLEKEKKHIEEQQLRESNEEEFEQQLESFR